MVPYCYLFVLSVFILWFTYYVSDIFRPKTKIVLFLVSRPTLAIKIDAKKIFFQLLSKKKKKKKNAYRLMCSVGKNNYKSLTDRKSNGLPKGREMNVLVCFVTFILPCINFR